MPYLSTHYLSSGLCDKRLLLVERLTYYNNNNTRMVAMLFGSSCFFSSFWGAFFFTINNVDAFNYIMDNTLVSRL